MKTVCEACGGDGGFDEVDSSIWPPDPTFRHTECTACDGTGEVEAETEEPTEAEIMEPAFR
jgi:hypothetical protein